MFSYLLITIYFFHLSFCANFEVYVNSDTVLRTVPERLLSISLDSVIVKLDWDGLNFTYIEPLATALGQIYFRFGGTAADLLIFEENTSLSQELNTKSGNNTPNIYLSGYQLEQICNFTRNVGWCLIFDLNNMHRALENENSKWNSSNAQKIINYMRARQYDFIDFELGNEPENYKKNFNFTLTGTQIAESYRELREMLNNSDLYENSIIMGPSVSAGGIQILEDFLNNSGGNYINAVSFHFYYENGAVAKLEDFLNSTILDSFKGTFEALLWIKGLYPTSKNLPLWAGETSSGYNGGTPNISNSYASGFIFLDKLGLSARYGLDVVVRQQLYDGQIIGSHYGLIDSTMRPNPDYWIAFLYKKLVGTNVYNISFTPENKNLRLYASNTKSNNGIVIYGVHLSNASLTIDFPQISSKMVTAYILQPNETGNLISRSNLLNGVLLEWKTHEPLPEFKKYITTLPLELPAYSQFFVVIDENKNSQCPNGWYQENTQSNKCIKFVNKTQPLFGANFDCGIFGQNASILSIDNAFENAEILKQAENSGCNQFYIGLVRNQNNFAWSNGDSSSYVNWKSGYPTTNPTQNCVIFDGKSGSWANDDCDRAQCYICQIIM